MRSDARGLARTLLTVSLLAACDPASPPSDDPGSPEGPPTDCGDDLAAFETHVWEPVIARRCTTCHRSDTGTAAARTRFSLPPDDLAGAMAAATAVADILPDKPTGLHPDGHGGGRIVDPDGRAHAALRWWRDRVQTGSCEAPEPWTCPDTPRPRLLRRLTHAEYDASVRALLGVEATPAAGFAADNVVDGYRNDARALMVSDLLATQYAEAAETLSQRADLDALLPCDPAVDKAAACAATFIEEVGFRAFRRPLSQEDVDRYHALWAQVAATEGFREGLRWVLNAFLQSPHFLYRSELGARQGDGTFTLTGWELASALSYSFLGGPPDQPLLEAAADGTLDTPEGLQAQIDRLKADPRAADRAAEMVFAWLELDRLQTVSRAGLDDPLRASMARETRDVVRTLAAEDATLDDLLLADFTVVDEVMAAHYGLSGPGETSLEGTAYGGLLTHASVVTTHGRHQGSSPVQRGVMVRERLLCEPLPPPPANVDTSPPELDPDQSTREHYVRQTADPQCAACHTQIDPIGFGFEHFDELGRYRATDGEHPVDDAGRLDRHAFDGVHDLAGLLADDPRVRRCFVRSWRRHATGVEACADDPGVVGLLDPLAELPLRTDFTVRTGEAGAGDTFAVGERRDPEPPEDDPELADGELVVETAANDWGAGYCLDVTVRNEATEAVVWRVALPADGALTNHWSSQVDDSGDPWIFTGVEHNRELDPGGIATFGFCAER